MNTTRHMKRKILSIGLILAVVGFYGTSSLIWSEQADPHDHGTHDDGHDDHSREDGHDEHDGHDDHEPAGHDEHEGHDDHEPAGHDEHDKHDDHGGGHEEGGHDDHEGHGHGGGEDLDVPVAELFARSCEHGVLAHECDECRYEVGVVKVGADLIERGLIQTAMVSERSFGESLAVTGEIRFDERKIAHLSPRIPGVVRSTRVGYGERVTRGQVLIELESVELAEAQTDYLQVLAEKRLARKAFDRHKQLRDSRITSEREFLKAEQEFEASVIRATAAEQKLLRLGASGREVSALSRTGTSGATGRMLIRSPFEGVVLELHAVRGERAEPGEQIVLVGDTSTLWLWVDIYEPQLAGLHEALFARKQLEAEVRVPAYPGQVFSGRLDYINGVMDEHTRTIKARVVLDNTEGKLKPGMFAKARILLGEPLHRLMAPRDAVLLDDEREFVFIHREGDYYVRRPVRRGQELDGFVVILDGLEAGARIVSNGSFLLKSDVLRAKMGEGCSH
jgi:membrane fusion protein, heavy metal efflux system